MSEEEKAAAGSGRTAGDEHRAFVARVEAVAAELGSRAELAKRAGIAPSSLQNYVDGSEPTRPVLIALARAARVSLGWLAGGSGPKRADSLPEGYFGAPYYDLRPYGDRIHPLLGQPSEFRIFSKSDYDESLLSSGILQALRTNQGFPPEISDGDLFVVDSAVHVGPVVGGSLFPRLHSALEAKAIYATAYQARLRLRRLRWMEVGKTMLVLAPGSKKAELTVTEKTLDFQLIGRVIWRGGPQPALDR
jgi:transcriptional regulator with XRE-family HTH domain